MTLQPEKNPDLVVLSGYMRILTPIFTEPVRAVNIHPSLLPDFKGAHAHRDVLAAGAKKSGCTVHYVIPEMDAGPIILQEAVDVFEDDTEESLSKRVLEKEHVCYPGALRMIAEGN